MSTPKNDTAVVVLSYNGKEYHEKFFPLLISESIGRYDIILIDNASTDDTLAYVHRRFPEVQTIALEKNVGFTGGYIEGLSQIDGYKYWVLLSADFEVSQNWFEPLYTHMESDDKIGACQPKIKYQREKTYFEYAGASGGFMDIMGYFFCRGRIFDTLEQDQGQYDATIDCFWAGGGCFFVRTDTYQRMGGLERELYAHMEEIDLCWRMKNAGYRISCVPASTVFHIGGSVISYGSPQKTFYNFRNNLLIFVKNFHGFKFWIWLIIRLLLDGIAGLKFLFSGEWANFWAIIRAHLSFYYLLPKFWSKRKFNRLLLKDPPNEEGVYKKLLLWDYYFRKNKTFSDLDQDAITSP